MHMATKYGQPYHGTESDTISFRVHNKLQSPKKFHDDLSTFLKNDDNKTLLNIILVYLSMQYDLRFGNYVIC